MSSDYCLFPLLLRFSGRGREPACLWLLSRELWVSQAEFVVIKMEQGGNGMERSWAVNLEVGKNISSQYLLAVL